MPAPHYEWNPFIVLGQRSILNTDLCVFHNQMQICVHNLFPFPRFNIHVKRLSRAWTDYLGPCFCQSLLQSIPNTDNQV